MIPINEKYIPPMNPIKALADFICGTRKIEHGRPECLTFEKQFAAYENTSDAVLFNSGGSANLALILVPEKSEFVGNGSKVGFSALTWFHECYAYHSDEHDTGSRGHEC